MSGKRLAIATAALATLLLIAAVIVATGLSGRLGEREATIAQLDSQVLSLQNQAGSLTRDRQTLTGERDQARRELADTRTQRDQARQEWDATRQERDAQTARVAELERTLADARRQVEALQRAATPAAASVAAAPTPTPTPAPTPSGRTVDPAALRALLALDDEILAEFNVFMGYVDAIVGAFSRGDFVAIQANFQRANQSSEKLRGLFARHAAATAPLR